MKALDNASSARRNRGGRHRRPTPGLGHRVRNARRSVVGWWRRTAWRSRITARRLAEGGAAGRIVLLRAGGPRLRRLASAVGYWSWPAMLHRTVGPAVPVARRALRKAAWRLHRVSVTASAASIARLKAVGSVMGEPRWRATMLSLITMWATVGTGLLLAAFTMEAPRPPQPDAQPARYPHLVPPLKLSSGGEAPAALPRSEPTRIEIPAIDVSAELLSLGVTGDNELAVPPLDKAHLASWYNLGPSPGELGSAVIVGHVDSEKTGPAVFFNLGRLKAGDLIKVSRIDGTVVQFKVDRVESFPKSEFPTDLIYTGLGQATLKVITCGGEFDAKAKNYLSNIIVFANYVP